MPSELKAYNLTPGLTYKAAVQNAAGQYWTGSGNNFAASSAITWASAGVALAPDGVFTGNFTGDFPIAITTPGLYVVTICQQAGGSLASSDVATATIPPFEVNWNGTSEIQSVNLTQINGSADAAAALGVPDASYKSATIALEDPHGHNVAGAEILISTDAAGSTVIRRAITDSNGKAVILLQAGTYYRWAYHAAVTFTNPQSFTVSA